VPWSSSQRSEWVIAHSEKDRLEFVLPTRRKTRKQEVSSLQSSVPIVQFDHVGLSGGRIQANNRAAVFHPLSLNIPTRSAGF
jgi:hypothetical protein